MLIAGLGALPLAALVDHELTKTVPARTKADTGIDSLTHALEAYVSKRANSVSDMYAERAMRLIGPHLRRVYKDPEDAAAREAMMLGATLAGLAFSNASVALVHGMSRPIGAHFHVPHGLSNAMLLPAVTGFGLNHALPRYAEAARCIGCAAPGDADQLAGAKLMEELRALNQRAGGAHALGLRHRRRQVERPAAPDGRAGPGLRQPRQQPPRPDGRGDHDPLRRGLRLRQGSGETLSPQRGVGRSPASTL
jgi:alcohol dehydrogenase class IV